MKLARVRIDIPNGVDSDWDIDVRKARAHPPYAIRERLRTHHRCNRCEFHAHVQEESREAHDEESAAGVGARR